MLSRGSGGEIQRRGLVVLASLERERGLLCCCCWVIAFGSRRVKTSSVLFVRTLELLEQCVELSPVLLGCGEFAVLAGLDVL